MEPSGVKKVGRDSEKTLRVVLAGMGVVIVGLLVAIVVVIGTRGGEADDEPVADAVEWYDETARTYDEYYKEITNRIVESKAENNGEAVEGIYKTYIDEIEDTTIKAMLSIDYYMTVLSFDYDMTKKDEIINALLAIDEKLKTVDSAVAVMNAGYYYGDEELVNSYENIVKERGNEEDK